ncbi:MAG TPA: hypothetical protein VFN49_10970, partial [Candidatus Aquilonibacter sp.]|nr:hypothetical protein [Candidatus Aquilonibacter sp.]
MKRLLRFALGAIFGTGAVLLAACGSGTSTTFSAVPVPSFSPSGPQTAPVATAAATMSPNGSAAGLTFGPSYTSGIATATVALGATTTSGNVQIDAWLGNPSGTAPLTASTGPAPLVYGYVTMTASSTVTFTTTPSIIVNFGASATTSGMSYYVAYLAPGGQSWQQPLLGPATAGGASQFTLPANLIAGPFTMQARQTYTFA